MQPSARANFDVGVLFYNRAHQTLDCALSFLNEGIQPNIVILDQGSAPDQRKFLQRALGSHFNVRFVGLTKNIGAAAGRNRLCRECSSQWILHVDNDAALNTRGGVRLISSALEDTNGMDAFCPKILNLHENRFVDRLQLTEKNSCLVFSSAEPHVEITNTFATTAVVLRRSLLLDHPFDERLLVGFEDFDFALRAFTDGRPLQVGSLNEVTFVHKHMPVTSEPDIASTRVRYSIPGLAKDFDVLRTKYGGKLFHDWELWTASQQQQMIVSNRVAPRVPRDKIHVTFVLDIPNGLFANGVRNLHRHIGDDHVLTTVYTQHDDSAGHSLFRILRLSPDIIHFMLRTDVRRLLCPIAVKRCARLMSLTEVEVLDRLCRTHITFSVCDHLFMNTEDIASFRPLYWLSDGYCVSSPMLFDVYERISDYPNPSALILYSTDSWENRAPLWRHFFAETVEHAHPDASNWKLFMFEKFFLADPANRDCRTVGQ
jgi:GT2 family glycosyltransferase